MQQQMKWGSDRDENGKLQVGGKLGLARAPPGSSSSSSSSLQGLLASNFVFIQLEANKINRLLSSSHPHPIWTLLPSFSQAVR